MTHSSVSSRAVSTWSSKRRRGVDDDEVEALLERAQDARDQHRRDPLADVGVRRRGQHHQGVLVPGQQPVEHRQVEGVLGADGLLDRVGREQLHGDRDVAEGEVEVDQAHLAGAALGQREGEVDRHRGLADAALGGEDGDDAAEVHGAGRAAQGLEQLVGLADRGADGVEVVGLHDVAGAGLHRPGEQRRCRAASTTSTTLTVGPDDAQVLADARARASSVEVGAEHDDVLVGVLVEPGHASGRAR